MDVFVNPPTKITAEDGKEFEIAFCTAHEWRRKDINYRYLNDKGEEVSKEAYYELYPGQRKHKKQEVANEQGKSSTPVMSHLKLSNKGA